MAHKGTISGWRWDTGIVSNILSLWLSGSLDNFFLSFFSSLLVNLEKKKIESHTQKIIYIHILNAQSLVNNMLTLQSMYYYCPTPSIDLKRSNGTRQSGLFCFMSKVLSQRNNTMHILKWAAEISSRSILLMWAAFSNAGSDSRRISTAFCWLSWARWCLVLFI